MTPRLCIAIHDVAPATWPACERLLALVDALGAPPATLLVVPDWHRRGTIDADPAFRRAIDARVARGDELALHGLVHLDKARPPRGAVERLRRRVLTAGEGEFAALEERESLARIEAGLLLFARCGWSARGFVAPAWLLGNGARAALARAPLCWTSTHAALEHCARRWRIAAPVLGASARSAWRRRASRAWLPTAARAWRDAPLLRIALHPADAAHAELVEAWRSVLSTLLAGREALTKSAAIAREGVADGDAAPRAAVPLLRGSS
ncbi:MAG TPA: DUF2334 domain-containing protein [Dokdonella sp.]|nr:DUF2334 domain-containing protein [Dokdonella sp.]